MANCQYSNSLPEAVTAPDGQTSPRGKPTHCTQEASISAKCSGAPRALHLCCPPADGSQRGPTRAPQVTPSHSPRAQAWGQPGTFIPHFFPWSPIPRCFPHTLSIWKQFLSEDSLQKRRHLPLHLLQSSPVKQCHLFQWTGREDAF